MNQPSLNKKEWYSDSETNHIINHMINGQIWIESRVI